MKNKPNIKNKLNNKSLAKKFFYWSIAVLVFKILILINIASLNFNIGGGNFLKIYNIWLGADGESYLKGYQALLDDGLFATDRTLNYWPAGYPLLILFLSIFGKSWVLLTLSLFQSIIFSFAIYFLAKQLLNTRLKNYVYLIFILVILNPTLSLSSLVVGYESLVASGIMITLAIIVKDLNEKKSRNFGLYLLINSLISSFISFLQPKFIVQGIIVNLVWILIRKSWKSSSIFVIASLSVTLIFPASLVYRNHVATGINNVATNLGAAMNAGAGKKTNGAYSNTATDLECDVFGSISEQDSQKVTCVLNWYLSNPTDAARLFMNKSIFFWSPWSGPISTGTMVRNPWLKINPITDITRNQEGIDLVYGTVGKIISWSWLLASIFLLGFGLIKIMRIGSIEKVIAVTSILIISFNWAFSLLTVGDNRFRIPIMGLSILLQAVGLGSIFMGKKVVMDGTSSLR